VIELGRSNVMSSWTGGQIVWRVCRLVALKMCKFSTKASQLFHSDIFTAVTGCYCDCDRHESTWIYAIVLCCPAGAYRHLRDVTNTIIITLSHQQTLTNLTNGDGSNNELYYCWIGLLKHNAKRIPFLVEDLWYFNESEGGNLARQKTLKNKPTIRPK